MRRRPIAMGAAALGLLVLVLVLARGLPLVAYEPERSDRYVWGAFHVHSTLSDGLLPLDGVAREARRARVGFVLLSEHGAPHPEAVMLDEVIDGVRFVGGSEVGLPEGHLIVSDASRVPRYKLPPFPPDAVADVSEWGGLSIVTYPEDPETRWTYWEPDLRPDGIEIINVTSYLRASSFWQKADWALFSLFSPLYYVSGFEPPTYALRRWDELLQRSLVYGFYAANAHGGFELPGGTTVRVPSYATAFLYAGLGIEPRHADAPAEAIRRGEFFAIVRAAGEPRRFEMEQDDESLRVVVETHELTSRIDLIRDGEVVASSRAGEIRYRARDAGVYRAEVYLEDHPLLAPDVPWILSQPRRVGMSSSPPAPSPPDCDELTPVPLDELTVETDDESSAALSIEGSTLVLDYHLSRATPERIDRWVALALRGRSGLDGTSGVRLVASSPETMRYRIEVRAGDRGHHASFKVTKGEPEAVVVPWERFYRTGGGREPVPLSEVDALFVTVDTSSSVTGFGSRLELRELSFCR